MNLAVVSKRITIKSEKKFEKNYFDGQASILLLGRKKSGKTK